MKVNDFFTYVKEGDIILFRKAFVSKYFRGQYAALLTKPPAWEAAPVLVAGDQVIRYFYPSISARDLENVVIRNGKEVQI